MPNKVLYSQESTRWLPFILIFFVQTFVLYKLLAAFSVPYKMLWVGLSPLVIGPSFGLYGAHRERADFEKNGVVTKGVVYKKWYKRKNPEWLLRCNYLVNGERYSTFSESDPNNLYKVGDTLTVIYINDFPQKCTIKELD